MWAKKNVPGPATTAMRWEPFLRRRCLLKLPTPSLARGADIVQSPLTADTMVIQGGASVNGYEEMLHREIKAATEMSRKIGLKALSASVDA
jgi:hypothetical protein